MESKSNYDINTHQQLYTCQCIDACTSCQRSPYGNIGVYYCDAYCLVTVSQGYRATMVASPAAGCSLLDMHVCQYFVCSCSCMEPVCLVVHGFAIMLPPRYVAVHRGNEWLQPRVQHVAETMRWVL